MNIVLRRLLIIGLPFNLALVVAMVGFCAEHPDARIRFPKDTARYASLVPLDRASLEPFFSALRSPEKRMKHFSLMVRQPDGPPVWFTRVSIREGKVYGCKGVTTEHVINYNLPEPPAAVEERLDVSNVIDWMYIHNYRLVGGKTIAEELAINIDYELKHGNAFAVVEDWDANEALCQIYDAIGDENIGVLQRLLTKDNVNLCRNASLPETFLSTKKRPPLYHAIMYRNLEAAKLCMHRGADLSYQTERSSNAICYAAQYSDQKTLAYLLDLGLPIDSIDLQG